MDRDKIKGSAAMIIATFFWGVAFSAQSRGMDHMGPVLFTALRSFTGVLALCAVMICIDLCKGKGLSLWGGAGTCEEKKTLLTGGLWCGAVISVASVLQQAGLMYTSAGKTGFLTALYIIIVPVAGAVFFKRKTPGLLWIGVFLALCGTYLLCGGVGNIGTGEILVIACACTYSVHVLVIDKYAAKCDCVRLSCIQFAAASVITGIGTLIFREPVIFRDIAAAMPFWLFCGVGSSAIAFTLQMTAQKYLHPVTAALLMSLESVFAVLGGWLFLQEKLSFMEICGCILIFAAVIAAQIPLPAGRKKV